jgi:hypothetical protein
VYGDTAVLAKSRVVILASWCLMQSVHAADGNKPQPIKVIIRPECKAMFYGPTFIDLDVHGKPIPSKKIPRPNYVEWDASLARPLSFKDRSTSTVFYVESDGRHLAAIGSDGKLLWVRNPFEDGTFAPIAPRGLRLFILRRQSRTSIRLQSAIGMMTRIMTSSIRSI